MLIKIIVLKQQLFLLPDYNKNSINRSIYLYELLDCFDTNWHTNHPMSEWGCHTDNCKYACKTVDSSTNPYWEEEVHIFMTTPYVPMILINMICCPLIHLKK